MFWACVQCFFCVYLLLKFIVHLTNARCKSNVCLVGKTALITGGNSGIGFELAKHLASRGCSIIIADKDDATHTVMALIKETNNPNISAKKVNFMSFKSVRLFAEEFRRSVEKLHILVNNAGVASLSSQKTEDGIQKIMQVNYLSHFLLTHLLIEMLLKSAPSRIIYTSSLAAYKADLSEKNIKGELISNIRSAAGSYGNSKLAGAIISKILAKKLNNTGVTSNACHPGLVRTNIWISARHSKKISVYSWLIWTYLFGKSPDEGVQTLLYLSCAKEIESVSGKFFMECIPVWQPKQVYDLDLCKRIWDLSENYVNLKDQEKLDIILQKWRTIN